MTLYQRDRRGIDANLHTACIKACLASGVAVLSDRWVCSRTAMRFGVICSKRDSGRVGVSSSVASCIKMVAGHNHGRL